ncbi:YcdB/YcdC domain-containing protein [Brevibacillus sp. NPDC003359]|uniref:YcdB/YcdC domain-containing protein n=1 Tax=unclassified Brevibacillus TaxID=2684853 RepID=UPI0036CE3A87
MSWHEEELENRLRRLKETESPPRLEYIRETERRLEIQTNRLKRRIHFQRLGNRVAGVVAIVLLGGWVSTESGQQSLHTLWSYTMKHEQPSSTFIPAPTFESAQPSPATPPPTITRKENTIINRPVTTNRFEKTTKPLEQKQPPAKTMPSVSTSQIKQPVTVTNTAPIPPAVKKAEAYVQEMLGEEGMHYRYNPSQSDLKSGTVGFSRIIHGIPVYEASYTVEMNGDEVSRFQISQQSDQIQSLAQIPKPTDVLSKEEAEEAIASTLRLVYREKGGTTASLRYEPEFSGFVDASTGTFVSSIGIPIQKNEGKRVIPVAAEGRRIEANRSEEALSLLVQEFGLPFATDNWEGSVSFGRDRIREMHWSEKGRELSARFHENGQLLSYRVNKSKDSRTSSSKNQAASPEVFLPSVIEHLQRYLDESIKELEMTGIKREAAEIRFHFNKMYQGISVIDHTYEVIVDTGTGEVVGMSGSFGQQATSFPDPAKAISKDAAEATMKKNQPLALAYIWTNQNGTADMQPLLVYHVNKEKGIETSIEAITGAVLEGVQE